MGSCFSKRNVPPPSSLPPGNNPPMPTLKPSANNLHAQPPCHPPPQVPQDTTLVKKEIFVIKHRKSHDRDKQRSPPQPPLPDPLASSSPSAATPPPSADMPNSNTALVRTSSCTKEEVDAILIQCGRLSRSNSSGPAKKYAGSKRSYDFDHADHLAQDIPPAPLDYDAKSKAVDEDDRDTRQHRHRHRNRQTSPSPSQGRRRTPSRERDQNQRSGSRERASNASGRRVSRSPGRRSEATPATNVPNNNANKPGKMVSVPATVSSLVMDKSNNDTQTTMNVKRISVKRNSSEASRSAASPRSQSPARANTKISTEPQQPSLTRNSSRKAEQSPHRRNPLAEIDSNSLPHSQPTPNKSSCVNRVQIRNREVEGQGGFKESLNVVPNQAPTQKPNAGSSCKGSSIGTGQLDNKIGKEQQEAGGEGLKSQALTRSRSARRSRDLDLNPENLLNPTPSYTTLLLEDIQNFHQKNTPVSSFSLPPCVTKACSILEAVADLNSTTSSNLSCALPEDTKTIPEAKDPFLESEVLVLDDLLEPSFHRYVTVRRGAGTLFGEDMDGQESSGSNSVVGCGSQHQLGGLSSSSWEPTSADSTDRWTSRSNTREDQRSDLEEAARKGFSGQRTGIGRGRLGANKNLLTAPISASN